MGATRPTSLFLVGLVTLGALVGPGCENHVSSTRQCLGGGGTTETYTNYTFDIETGPAVDVAGNCHVVLEHCTIRAPQGIRVSGGGQVTVVGGSLVAREAAVIASDNARVSFDGTEVVGTIQRTGAATVSGVPIPEVPAP